LSTSLFILLNQNQLNVFAVFTVNQNDNEDSDSVAKIILTKIKYRSDRFSDDIAGQLVVSGYYADIWLYLIAPFIGTSIVALLLRNKI